MRKRILFSITLFTFYAVSAAQDPAKWNTEKSAHFVVNYRNAPEDFIKEIIDKSESLYNSIASDLGFIRFNFWLWDERAKIYIYDNALDYQSATGQPAWSIGCAVVKKKAIHAFPYAEGFFEATLPHELGHIIFREFVGFSNNAIPLWLDEGVASYQEKTKYKMANKFIKEAISKNKFINPDELSNIDPRLMQNPELVSLFYAEAFSIVDFLIKEFDKDKFVLFCRNLRDKINLDRAIASSYPFNNIKELGSAWRLYLENG
jgi:hypothetical protein